MTRITIAVIITLLTAPAVQADRLEVIQLHNRPADEMISVVGPIMKPGEALSGTGFKLILRASPETIAEVRRIVSKIDAGLKNLVISVAHAGARRREENAAGAAVRYDSEEGGAVAGYIGRGRSENESAAIQKVRVVEGRSAWIDVGRTLFAPGVLYGPAGALVYGPLQRSVGTGFHVVPRIVGDRVHLEISAHRHRPAGAGPSIDASSASTVVTGAVGEWIDIGGAVQSVQAMQSGIASGAQSSGGREESMRIRVDIAE